MKTSTLFAATVFTAAFGFATAVTAQSLSGPAVGMGSTSNTNGATATGATTSGTGANQNATSPNAQNSSSTAQDANGAPQATFSNTNVPPATFNSTGQTNGNGASLNTTTTPGTTSTTPGSQLTSPLNNPGPTGGPSFSLGTSGSSLRDSDGDGITDDIDAFFAPDNSTSGTTSSPTILDDPDAP